MNYGYAAREFCIEFSKSHDTEFVKQMHLFCRIIAGLSAYHWSFDIQELLGIVGLWRSDIGIWYNFGTLKDSDEVYWYAYGTTTLGQHIGDILYTNVPTQDYKFIPGAMGIQIQSYLHNAGSCAFKPFIARILKATRVPNGIDKIYVRHITDVGQRVSKNYGIMYRLRHCRRLINPPEDFERLSVAEVILYDRKSGITDIGGMSKKERITHLHQGLVDYLTRRQIRRDAFADAGIPENTYVPWDRVKKYTKFKEFLNVYIHPDFLRINVHLYFTNYVRAEIGLILNPEHQIPNKTDWDIAPLGGNPLEWILDSESHETKGPFKLNNEIPRLIKVYNDRVLQSN